MSRIIENGIEKAVGDPTETAIVSACLKAGYEKGGLEKEYPRLFELPFDSDRKLMTTVNVEDGKAVQYTKGAVDELLARCSYIYENDKIRKITLSDIETIKNKKALRFYLKAFYLYFIQLY